MMTPQHIARNVLRTEFTQASIRSS